MKILLLQLKRIGDLILTTPAIAALRENYPDAHITLAVSNECAELLPAISNVDRVLIARRNLRDVAMVSSVAGKRFDYCIDFTRNDRSAFLTLLSGARRRVASYRVREQSKTRARFTLILLESVCGICTRSTTIWLCLSRSASVLLLPLRSSNFREQRAKKLTGFGVIGKSRDLT